jgi:VWFA-related protein
MPRTFAFLALAAAGFAFAQDGAVFRSGVSLVHVDAEVTARDGRILTGFSKADFRVFDEGKEQPIVNFASEDQPLDLILLFDVSGSMRAVVEGISSAAREGLRELRQGDRVSVMVFNSRSKVVLPFTEDLDAVERSIRGDVLGRRFGGGTLIQQAVDDAAMRFLHEPQTGRRRAVLITTDNMGMRTRNEQAVVRDFWEADALLSGLIVANPVFQAARAMHPASLLLSAGMKGIAEKTGGDAIRSGDAGAGFQEMMRRIRSRYSLYYRMPEGKDGQPRTIRVELSADAKARFPGAHVRARKGYVMPKETAPSR